MFEKFKQRLHEKHHPGSALLKEAKKLGTLEDTHEYELIRKWRETQDERYVNRLVKNHQKLVNAVVRGYKGYGLPLDELIAEAQLGMMHALKHFDTAKGVKFSTYAIWWIKSTIQKYVFNTWSLVNMSASSKHKRLFFKLRKTKAELGIFGPADEKEVKVLAEKLEVTPVDIRRMEARLSKKDYSLNTKVSNDGDNDSEFQDWLPAEDMEKKILRFDEFSKRRRLLNRAVHSLKPKEKKVLFDRRLRQPPKTLENVGDELSLSKERVRQIENDVIGKLQSQMKKIIERNNLQL